LQVQGALWERSVIEMPGCRFEDLALQRREVQRLRQESDCIPPRRTSYATLNVCNPANAEMSALGHFLLS
jgi:hypothetical protein